MGASNKTLDSSITKDTGCRFRTGAIAGVSISAGQLVYFDSANQRYQLAIGDAAASSDVSGVALNTAAAGQILQVAYYGTVKDLTGLEQGKIYVVSDNNAGDIMEVDDLASGDYVTFIGIATSATELFLNVTYSGVTAVGPVT